MPGQIHLVTQVVLDDGVQTSTLMYLRTDADPTGAEELAIHDTMLAQWVGLWRAIVTSSTEQVALVIKRLLPMTRPAIVFPTSSFGLTGGEALPTNASQVISHFSSDGSRRNRGRFTWCGIPEVANNGGHLDGAHLASMANLAASFTASLFDSAADGSYTFMHRRSAIPDYVQINRTRVNPNVRTSRGRTLRTLGT
jgi:hypothetical protein